MGTGTVLSPFLSVYKIYLAFTHVVFVIGSFPHFCIKGLTRMLTKIYYLFNEFLKVEGIADP